MKAELLSVLRDADDYVSGQDLCEKFGVSRTAVWKGINQLKEAGYEIEAVPNKGYKLLSVPDTLSEEELKSIRKTAWVGQEIFLLSGHRLHQYQGEAAGGGRLPYRNARGRRTAGCRQRQKRKKL